LALSVLQSGLACWLDVYLASAFTPFIMLDLQLIRDNPSHVRESLAKKKFHCDFELFLELDQKRREALKKAEDKRCLQKKASDAIASLDKKSEAFLNEVKAMKTMAEEVKALEKEAHAIELAWEEVYLTLPNIPHSSVPLGHRPEDSPVVTTWGDIDAISAFAKPHYDIPHFDRGVDFARGSKVSGAGFPFYAGDCAKLVRALLQFFLDEAEEAGYEMLMPPIVINEASARATGQLPDKEGMMYFDSAEGLYLIPTAEVPVTNFFRDEIIEEAQLPLKRAAYTPCFRREAGSWGKDVRGLNRLHQFDKVELVKWTAPEESFKELESLRLDAEKLLQKLELPYRVLSICAGDMGFTHSKQYDLEVWAGGQKRWLEVSSCSNFTSFQAHRAKIRYRSSATQKLEYVHTLNASALAIPRVLAALLENNLCENGSVRMPAALKPWFKKDFLVF
jgi:seryl-tRNA synthetase